MTSRSEDRRAAIDAIRRLRDGVAPLAILWAAEDFGAAMTRFSMRSDHLPSEEWRSADHESDMIYRAYIAVLMRMRERLVLK